MNNWTYLPAQTSLIFLEEAAQRWPDLWGWFFVHRSSKSPLWCLVWRENSSLSSKTCPGYPSDRGRPPKYLWQPEVGHEEPWLHWGCCFWYCLLPFWPLGPAAQFLPFPARSWLSSRSVTLALWRSVLSNLPFPLSIGRWVWSVFSEKAMTKPFLWISVIKALLGAFSENSSLAPKISNCGYIHSSRHDRNAGNGSLFL